MVARTAYRQSRQEVRGLFVRVIRGDRFTNRKRYQVVKDFAEHVLSKSREPHYLDYLKDTPDSLGRPLRKARGDIEAERWSVVDLEHFAKVFRQVSRISQSFRVYA